MAFSTSPIQRSTDKRQIASEAVIRVQSLTRQLRDALLRLEVKAGERLRRFNAETPRYTDLDGDAILKSKTRADGTWHWVVWDASRKRLLDPKRIAYKRLAFTSYLEIKRPIRRSELR